MRGAGWGFVHLCVDDRTRLACVEVLDDERSDSVIAFLQRTIAWLAAQGVTVERVMSDNGADNDAGYHSQAHAAACRQLGLRLDASARTPHDVRRRRKSFVAACESFRC